MFSTLQCGVRIFNTLPTTANQVSKWQRMETNHRETRNTRTFADAEKKHKEEPRKPADTYAMLRKNIRTYAMFLLVLFGQESRHYQGVWAIRRIMTYHKNDLCPFTIKYCQEITWSIVVNSRHYFYQAR